MTTREDDLQAWVRDLLAHGVDGIDARDGKDGASVSLELKGDEAIADLQATLDELAAAVRSAARRRIERIDVQYDDDGQIVRVKPIYHD